MHTPPQASGVTPVVEGVATEPPKMSGVTLAVEGMLVSGVTFAASIKATGGEPSPWEGMTSEVNPWEGMTADIEEDEWTEVRRRRATGRGRPAKGESSRARRPRARDTDSNIIVRSGDRDSSTAAIQISPIVPQVTDHVVPVIRTTH